MKAIFAGTFDPFTSGHRNIVERAARLFDTVTVAVAADTGKITASLEVRTAIAKSAIADIANAEAVSFCGLLSDYVKAIGECVLIRGVRSSVDLEYEREITRVYKSLCGVDSLVLITDAEYEHVSSTVVRSIAALGGDISGYIVPCTKQKITEIYGKKRKA